MTRKIVMQQLKAILQRLAQSESYTKIERSLRVSHGLIWKIKKRTQELAQPIEELLKLDDLSLQGLFYPPNTRTRVEPDWQEVLELSRKRKVTLQMIYEEVYGQNELQEPRMAYKTFCQHFVAWKKENGIFERTSNLEIIPGEQLQIDYAGTPITWIDLQGQKHVDQVFVASLPASKLTFAFATPKQKRSDWIDGLVAALEYMGGSPKVLVVDNPKALVSHPDRYEARFPPEISDVCAYYSMTPCACKPAKPREKNRVEAAVNDVERHVIAKLQLHGPIVVKDRESLNVLIGKCCDEFNLREFCRIKGQSRRSLFEAYEKPTLKTLPASSYERCEWRCLMVDNMHCVRISSDAGHRYSVPSSHIGKTVHVRLTATQVECFDMETNASLGCHERCYNSIGEKTHILEQHLTQAEKELHRAPNYYKKKLVAYGVPEDIASTVIDKFYTQPRIVARKATHGLMSLCRKTKLMAIVIEALEIAIRHDQCSYRYIKDAIHTIELRREEEKHQGTLLLEPSVLDYQTPEHPNIRNNYV